MEGLPHPIVKNGFIEVPDKPGLGVKLNVEATQPHLSEEDQIVFPQV